MLVRLSRGFGTVCVDSSRYMDNMGERGVWSGSCSMNCGGGCSTFCMGVWKCYCIDWTLCGGVKGRAVSEAAGIWMKGRCSRVWSGGLCKGCGCRVRLVSVVGVFRM